MTVIGIRREDKSPWERRSPLIPADIETLCQEHGLRVLVQPSDIRIYSKEEFQKAGAEVTEDLAPASVVLAVKEIPKELLAPNRCYVFFSHVIKGQPYNMAMLARLMELNSTLVDYERIVDEQGRRLVFFGVQAGQAGMMETLYALGRRQARNTPLAEVKHAHEYDGIAAAKAHLRDLGRRLGELPAPLVFGITGYGNVSQGAQEVLDCLPVTELTPNMLRNEAVSPGLYKVVFREEHMVAPINRETTFRLQDYFDHPEKYRGRFEEYLPFLDVLVNTIYWDERYPRLVTKAWVRAGFAGGGTPRLGVIGDISCDIGGSIEMTAKVTEPGDPSFVWDPDRDRITMGYKGRGMLVMAVDILPSELPRDASENFSRVLREMVPVLAATDWNADFADLSLPYHLATAVITHRGALTPRYQYLNKHLPA